MPCRWWKWFELAIACGQCSSFVIKYTEIMVGCNLNWSPEDVQPRVVSNLLENWYQPHVQECLRLKYLFIGLGKWQSRLVRYRRERAIHNTSNSGGPMFFRRRRVRSPIFRQTTLQERIKIALYLGLQAILSHNVYSTNQEYFEMGFNQGIDLGLQELPPGYSFFHYISRNR